MSTNKDLKVFLDRKVDEFHQPSFIKKDPICVPHMFSKKQDIEIAGFFAAIFAWGNRTTIIQKTKLLMELMHNAPHDFCLHHEEKDLRKLLGFKHRTFNDADLFYFIDFFKHHYSSNESLESAFTKDFSSVENNVEQALNYFYSYFFSLEHLHRTKKHIAAPFKNSACKRINMFLRWMVRSNDRGVDFGLWKNIRIDQLIIPLDLHVSRVAKHFGLLQRENNDWKSAVELTQVLKKFDANDPVKYDYALFALGVLEKYS